jgi:hypothetical protein
MATVQSVLDSARYDLHDYQTGLMWDDTELLNYLNRMVGVMDSTLAVLSSDLVEAEETDIDCVADQNYVDLASMNSGLWDSIRSVYISTNMIYPITMDLLRYKRIYRNNSARPYYYGLSNRRLEWDVPSDSAYTSLIIYYNKKTADLALTDSMPYSDIFNEFFRSQLITYAKSKQDGANQGDQLDVSIFNRRAREEVIRRNFNKKYYHIDF